MNIKARLKVQLVADEVVVAEAEDPALWQHVFGLLSGHKLPAPASNRPPETETGRGSRAPIPASGPVAALAAELDLDPETVEVAISPELSAPFLHLDVHCYEAFRRNIPARGRGSIANAALAATLLVLWQRHAGFEAEIGTSTIHAVLDTLDLPSHHNTVRSLRNCRWLRLRGERVTLHPAATNRALAVARAFCAREPVAGEPVNE